MPLLLAESAKLSNDMVQRGVIETILEESPMLRMLPFLEVEGNSFKYNQETTLGGAQFYAVNGVWSEGTATFTQKTTSLAILGGDADVDAFVQRTRSNMTDQRAIQTMLKAKDVARKWQQAVISGDTSVDPNAFDGLKTLYPSTSLSGQVMTPAAGGGALTLALLDQLIDLVKGGKPDLLLMSKRTRRKLKSLLTASAHYVETGESSFGRQVMFYDGIPVLVSDYIADTEAADNGSGSTFSSIYAIHVSPADGMVGLTNGGIEAVDIGPLETKDASRVRIRWYVGLAVLRDSAIARMNGVSAA
ncbi:MAG TPA: phage major capsid protein [Chloroflexota bacterium]|nr:phage major capsid protein [Chloroflexota bacterium]